MDEKEMNGTPADESADLALDDSLELADETGDGTDGTDEEIEISEESEATADDGKDEEEDPGDDAEDDFDLEEALKAAFAEGSEDENGDETGGDTAGDEKPDEKSEKNKGGDSPEADVGNQAKSTEKNPAKLEKKEESEDARELRELKAKYDKLERRSKDALKSLGIDETDAVKGLERLAQEQSDMNEKEYSKELERRDAEEDERRKTESERAANERAGIIARIEAKKKADLEAIHTAYPASRKYERLDDIPGFERFKVLRDAGVVPEDAYAVVDPAGANEFPVETLHRKMLSDSKSHLKSVGGKSAGSAISIPRSEYKIIKSMLGDDVSDTEIAKYYKKVKGK